MGDLKGMNSRFLVGLSFAGYGCTMAVGLGIPIPILTEEIAYHTSIADDEIEAPIEDSRGKRDTDRASLKPREGTGDSGQAKGLDI